MRFRVRGGQVESPKARADGKGWDTLSLLPPGKLEAGALCWRGSWRVGGGQSWGQSCPSWRRLESWAGQVSLALSLCSAHRISYLHHPHNRGAHLKQWLKFGTFSYRYLSHQSRVSGGIRADLILSSHQYWDGCQTGIEIQSPSCSDMLKQVIFSLDLRKL